MTGTDTILEIIHDVLKRSGKTVSVDKITAETDLLREGYADSLTLMNVMMEVEQRFQCTIPPARLSGGNISSATRIRGILDEILERQP